ncbi:hypothetical protein OH76DRAFT_542454 [Lentinus brumalis]|uniref:Uncharacterized protein n=1 Tax=Lentinus brumalis TaxID=2498619 RepID=A0A371D9T9_9APHY|nr:hypothetical protein OH76DRAFT_542454 [Polyporus brumalis]
MHSPTTPRPHTVLNGRLAAWKPWSVPVDTTIARRKMRGLLNKVTPANAESLAGQFSLLVVQMEKSGDSILVESCVRMLVKQCASDPARTDLVAKLVQRAVDEAEGESLRWRSVYPYHLADLSTSLPTSLRPILLEELGGALRDGREANANALSSFAGELLVLGVLTCDDLHDVVGLLFGGTSKGSKLYCIVLCRMLRRIVISTEASHIIDGLGLLELIEEVLKEDTISLQVRYVMMSMLDHCSYPRPEDAFDSDSKRNEIYGFHDDTDYEHLPGTPLPASSPKILEEQCTRAAHALFATRNLAASEKCYLSLSPSDRIQLLRTFIMEAMASGTDYEAALVASFLSLPSLRRGGGAQFQTELVKAFEPHVVMLDDTALDIPLVYRTMALMLHASGLPMPAVEDLAARIVVPENPARDRLLEEIIALGPASPGEEIEGHVEALELDPSGEESSSSDYAYAY